MKKKIAIGSVCLILLAGIFFFTQNKEKPETQTSNQTSSVTTGSINCKQATAQAHTPGNVSQPKLPVNPLPKKFTFTTNCGDIEVSLDEKAPITITSLSALIKGKYYDNSLCHRLTTQGLYVLQCGDPTLTGAGNPTGWVGYKDENLPANGNNNYPAGTVAMANSGPGTNGSQVFFVYADTTLGANYTIWGKITKGLDIVQYIAKQGAITKDANGKLVYTGDGFTAQPMQIVKAIVS